MRICILMGSPMLEGNTAELVKAQEPCGRVKMCNISNSWL